MKYPSVQLALMSYAGLNEYTSESVVHEMMYAKDIGAQLHFQRISGDALISRSRSRALSTFLNVTDADVMVMIDHDMQWNPGDVLEIGKAAIEANGLVGGLYCKRAFNRGWSSRITVNGSYEFGKPGVLECESLATGFLAIPRLVALDMQRKLDIEGEYWREGLKEVLETNEEWRLWHHYDMSIGRIKDGSYRKLEYDYFDFFRCVRRPSTTGSFEFLSEDWAFSARARYCGHKIYVSTKPMLVHWGDYGFHLKDGMDDIDKQSGGSEEAALPCKE